MTTQEFTFAPPNFVVAHYAARAHATPEEMRVLDVGCGPLARNTLHLAGRGFELIDAIDNDPDAIAEAKLRAAKVGVTSCNFVELDCKDLSSLGSYDVVMANEILQDFEKNDAYDLIRDLQERTNKRGVHLVSSYVTQAAMMAGESNRLFSPGELRRFYEASGWNVEWSQFRPGLTYNFNGKSRTESLTGVIARRRA